MIDINRGIGPEDRVWLLYKFFEAERRRGAVEGGTGLGLSTSRTLATLPGGEIEVESELEQGSTFRVRIPASYVAPAPGPAAGD